MAKKVLKIFLYLALTFVVAIVGLAWYTQTTTFHENLRSTVYKLIGNNLNAKVYIGEISGSILRGFTIDTVIMYVDNQPFVEAGQIAIRYHPSDFLRSIVRVDSLNIKNPSIHLIRWKNGEWNVDHISKSTTPPDSVPTKWQVDAKKIALVNATFHLIDSTGNLDSSVYIDGRKSINYSNFEFSHLNVSSVSLPWFYTGE